MESLTGRSVVITGASSGIGEATARVLAAEGADLVLGARRLDRLEDLAEQLQNEHEITAIPVRTDVTDREQVVQMTETAIEEYGSIYGLVNNAGVGLTGIGQGTKVETMDDDSFRTMMDVNTFGMFYATRAALPHLRKTQGIIVFMGSFAGQYPRSYNPVYAGTKWWARGFAKSLEAQVGADGIGISIINPTEVRTEFGSEQGDPFHERFDEGEAISPESVARAVRFALNQESTNTIDEINIYKRDKLSDF